MRIALSNGESVQITILDDDKVVGTLSLVFDTRGGVKAVRAGRPASAPASAAGESAPAVRRGRGRGRRVFSDEARAKMSAAQKARWAKRRGDAKGSKKADGKK